jgi:glycosyltransferase involved in cell wall biosynthesis
MKLLVLSTWFPHPPDNGSRLRALHLLRNLSARHEVTLLSLGVPRRPDHLAVLEQMCVRVECVEPPPVGMGGLTARGLFSPVPRHFVQTDSARMRSLVAEAASRADAALALQIDAARYVVGVAHQLPSVFDEVEVGVLREQCSSAREWRWRVRHALTWFKFRNYVRSVVKRFDYATVVSEQERQHLREIGCDAQRIVVVPNGMAVSGAAPVDRRVERLVYPGSVTYSANLDAVRYFVDDVFPLLRGLRPALSFHVTGTTDGVDVRDLASVDGVTFTGSLPDVEPAIAESAACVVPLRIGGGTRLKVLHAMAVGTPVVSTSKGIEGLDVEPERHVLVADTPERFADQVVRLLDDPALGMRLAQAGRALVEQKYAWGPIVRTLEQTIERAVEERGSGRQAPGSRG